MMCQHTFASIMFLASGVKVLQSIFDWLMFSTEAEIPAEMDLLYVQTTLGWVFLTPLPRAASSLASALTSFEGMSPVEELHPEVAGQGEPHRFLHLHGVGVGGVSLGGGWMMTLKNRNVKNKTQVNFRLDSQVLFVKFVVYAFFGMIETSISPCDLTYYYIIIKTFLFPRL